MKFQNFIPISRLNSDSGFTMFSWNFSFCFNSIWELLSGVKRAAGRRESECWRGKEEVSKPGGRRGEAALLHPACRGQQIPAALTSYTCQGEAKHQEGREIKKRTRSHGFQHECVCMCVCGRKREAERETEKDKVCVSQSDRFGYMSAN